VATAARARHRKKRLISFTGSVCRRRAEFSIKGCGLEFGRAQLDIAFGAPVGDRLKAGLGSSRLDVFVIPRTWGLLGRGGLAGTRGGCAPHCPWGLRCAA
jgi:hypothetical protein